MLVTFIIGLGIFLVSFLLSLLIVLGAILKTVGATSFGITPVLFFLLFPCFCLTMEFVIFHTAPNAWGISYVFIVLNAYFLVIQHIFLVGSAIFTKNNIYRLTKFLVWKRYSYDDVVGYVMKKTSGLVVRKFGQHTVVTFDVEIYFIDNQYAFFSTKDQNNRKISHIKQLLEEHHCHRNGRIKRKSHLRK